MPDKSERLVPNPAKAPKQRWRPFRRRVKGDATQKKASRRGDLTVAALGVTLGLLCATFPWYIFFNPEQFGAKGTAFRIVPGLGNGRATLSPSVVRQGLGKNNSELPADLDLFATGTAPEEEKPQAPPEQPFPDAPPPVFHVIHIENGRAMIEDDSGLYVVGRGDKLPDGTRITGFEEREGKPVVTTSDDRVLAPES